MQWIKLPPRSTYLYQKLLSYSTKHLCLFIFHQRVQQPATCPYPNSSNSCACIFFIRSILIVLHLHLDFSKRLFPSGTQPRSCMHVLFMCHVSSSDVSQHKGPLQHTVTWCGHLLALTGTQIGETLQADSSIY